MRKRRFRLRCSSDEDDDLPSLQTINAPCNNPSHSPLHPQNTPLEISDDDFVEADTPLSDHSFYPAYEHAAGVTFDHVEACAESPFHASAGPIDELFRGVGLALRREWIASCLFRLAGTNPGLMGLNVAEKARKCFELFLLEDMNDCGAGILPENVHCMDKVELEGPFVLQIDEANNISCPLRERYNDSPAGLKRCLKLSISDGVQHAFGMEYRPISDLEVLSPSGLKIKVRNVQIRRGLLLLVPEVVEVLGGLVEDLDAARQRVIIEVTKPPRGKRNQALVPLRMRATLAAWPSNTSKSNEANTSHHIVNNSDLQENISVSPTVSNIQVVQGIGRSVQGNVVHGTGSDIINSLDCNDSGRNLYQRLANATEEGSNCNNSLNAESNSTTEHAHDGYARGEDCLIYGMSSPVILIDEREIPFVYLACLLAKWNIEKHRISFIQGRIKCTLTGVKSFQFRQRSAYELIVYVDDGSYISEVSIDHKVVQSGIGFSPENVTAALSSSDKKKKTDMTDTMKKYQLFLSMFEGMILVEINKDSPIPVILEMEQGCPTSDAWLLLKRLKSFTSQNLQ